MRTYLKLRLPATAFVVAILAATYALIAQLVPLSTNLFGEYHVVADFLLGLLLYGLLSALTVRLLLKIRPIGPGEYPMESPVFAYWILLTVVRWLGQGALLPFTPVFMKPVISMLFGARIGADVALGGSIDEPCQVSIGDGAVIGFGSLVSGNLVNNGKLVIGEVKIGNSVMIGVHSVVLPGTEIGDNAVLLNGSYVVPGMKIPAGETWRGNPARKWT